MTAPEKLAQQRYNTTFKARKDGFIINARKRQVVAYFDEITKIIRNRSVFRLIDEFGFTVVENKQLKMKFKKS